MPPSRQVLPPVERPQSTWTPASSCPTTIVLGSSRSSSSAGGPLERGFILDGFPRTLPPGRGARGVLTASRSTWSSTSTFPPRSCSTASPAGGSARAAARTYHVNMPPKENWTCDICGGKVIAATTDDTEEAVARRLELYEEQTVPIIDFYRGLERARHGRRRRRPATRCSHGSCRQSTSARRAATPVITRKSAEQIALDAPGGTRRGRDARGVYPGRGAGATTADVDRGRA